VTFLNFISKVFFELLEWLDHVLWSYVGFTLVVAFGLFFTIKTKGYQFQTLMHPIRLVRRLMQTSPQAKGTHPLSLYFASLGGSVGLGNVVAVVTVVTMGGPGGIFWLWVAAFAGMLIKYSEIYLGIKYRVANKKGGYDGGPMYYLANAFSSRWIPSLVAFLLCIYGVEVSQFLILTDTFSDGLGVDRHWIVMGLLALVFYGAMGGVSRLAKICSIMMPPFLIAYMGICLWVVVDHWGDFCGWLPVIFKSAFTGYGAIGGFAGSTFLLAAQYGTARAVYSGDIGIGYDSIIQSETKAQDASLQARLSILSLLNNTIICTLSCLVVLVSKLWITDAHLKPSDYVRTVLAGYIPYVDTFLLVAFFLIGFTTIMAYFVIGIKAARFLSPRFGERVYWVYALVAFPFFAYHDQREVMLLMTVSGGFLMIFNLLGIWKLRKNIQFDRHA
jgi:AGCS family alanine or glycine:cation symporter